MTHIVKGTKKALKLHLRCPDQKDCPQVDVYFEDPSMFEGAWSGWASEMDIGHKINCTNHPKRSWFATVERMEKGFKVT